MAGGDLTPWLLFGGFVSVLAATIGIGLRALLSGKIVAGRHYDDARTDEADWKTAAQTALAANATALAANAEISANFVRVITAVESLTTTTRETQTLVRQLLASPTDRNVV